MRALLLSLIAGLFLLPAYSQPRTKLRLNVNEDKLDSVKHYHKLLIVGEGNMQARMYVQSLSEQLSKALKKQEIECKYEYLGDSDKNNIAAALEKAKSWSPDAILRFIPAQSSEQTKQHIIATENDPNNRMYRYVDRSNSLYLTNAFDIILNDQADPRVWSARLSTVIEAGQPTIYKRISKMIITGMIKQNIFPKS
ncbi:hypothetical protein [Chitinophaga rhizophila]|uniref:DUF218 domain-containing protein n=1 Tax=Chitinophaga rhizophila TaxID=2866212 RepID=A0ABS7GH50_9BACT|nr:hypothetical protein [Chitinophaga rhizophila]MBW8686099.1 hypothetical protein [Chitinophaga rhizophila]